MITKWSFLLALFVLAHTNAFSQATVSAVSCSNNGTFENASDDFMIFRLNPDVSAAYSVTATFAGNPVTVTLLNDNPATNVFHETSTYFKIANGGLGAGNFTLTITPTSGAPKTVTVPNTGTCSNVNTTPSTNNKVTYYFYSPYGHTELMGSNTMPKFNEGTTRKLTHVKVEYGVNFFGDFDLNNASSGPVNYRFREHSDLSFSIAGNAFSQPNFEIIKNPAYPSTNSYPVGFHSNPINITYSNIVDYSSQADIFNFVGAGTITNSISTNTQFITAGGAMTGVLPTLRGSYFYKVEYTYDNMLPSVLTCTSESSMLNSASVTATASSGTGAQHVIDNDLTAANYWQTSGADNHITIDYGQNYVLNGFTYYPTTNGNTVLDYIIQTSTDNVTFTTVNSGVFPNYNTTTHRQDKGNPTTVRFTNPVNARYFRMIVAGNGKRVAEIIPIVCGTTPLNMTCADVNKVSSGTDEAGTGKKLVRNLDNNWTVTHFAGGTGSPATSTYNYNSIANALFYPAIVVGKAVNTPPYIWATSPFGNSEWISATQNGQDINSQGLITGADNTLPNTYFFKYKFNIADPLLAASLKLRLDYYVDNLIVRVYVNGVNQNINSTDVQGYADGHQKSTLLDSDFQVGTNELIVQVFSTPGFAGLLVQGIPSCYCLKDPTTTGTGTDTKHGITLLKRAGANDNDNWPMIRKSAHTVLESNSKGFVPTRMTTANLSNITMPVEGMMVFDTTAKCLKIYDGASWKCFTTPTCPQ